MNTLTIGHFDFLLIIALIIIQIGVGIFISRKGKGSEDYFMAGRKLPWWVVGGSVFSTNISASHLIGMLGIGYSVGFAQSHYEILAVFAILILAFLFIPVYRRLPLFTLSQFLEKRFGDKVRLTYALLVLLLIIVQLIGHYYIGARALSMLTQGSLFEINYPVALLLLSLIICSYTFFGGLSAVVYTDTLQAVFIIVVAIILCYFTFSSPEINGFSGLLTLDSHLPEGSRKMNLYLPANHPDLPVSGVFTGLILLHFFYWITNQYLVQRVLAAKSDDAAKYGVMVAGLLKLGIPFVTIATGVAAAHLLNIKYAGQKILPDDAFLYLVNAVIPAGFGLIGLLISGVLASTFSTIDSMMNSATTLFCIDIYKKYYRKNITDKELVIVGRLVTLTITLLAAVLAYATYNPQSAGNFFLKISSHGSYFTPGIIVVFFAAVFVRRIPSQAVLWTMVSAPFIAILLEVSYSSITAFFPTISSIFGEKLNFLHRVALTSISSVFLLFISRFYLLRKVGGYQLVKEDDQLMAIGLLMAHRWKIIGFLFIHAVSVTILFMDLSDGKQLSFLIAPLSGSLFLLNIGQPFSFSGTKMMAAVLMSLCIWILYYFS
jgi:SSS family solute:Na+ symporter